MLVSETPESLATRAADEFAATYASALAEHGRLAVALSGGKTPRTMLEELAARSIDWRLVHFFWSDERCVGPDDPNSNYRMAREALLSRVAPPPANVHRMKGELDPPEGARDYSEQLRAFFAGPPSFDLVYLGLGPDGHTASLFPGTTALHVTDEPCVANRVDGAGVASPWRLTLTFPAINAARRVIFLVEGLEKAAILKRVIEGAKDVERYPAQGIAPAGGDLLWLADASAAALLESSK
jgi:6-phosphogluconolactonase